MFHTRAHTHIHTHTRTHRRTHRHTYTCPSLLLPPSLSSHLVWVSSFKLKLCLGPWGRSVAARDSLSNRIHPSARPPLLSLSLSLLSLPLSFSGRTKIAVVSTHCLLVTWRSGSHCVPPRGHHGSAPLFWGPRPWRWSGRLHPVSLQPAQAPLPQELGTWLRKNAACTSSCTHTHTHRCHSVGRVKRQRAVRMLFNCYQTKAGNGSMSEQP